MAYDNYNIAYSVKEEATNSLIRSVYLWMACALALTGLTAAYVANSPAALQFIFGHVGVLIGLFVAELALVFGLSAAIDRLTPVMATAMFVLYSVINGLTLSSIFIIYEMGSIATTFFVTAGTFGAMALYGTITKKDLTKIGNLCIMALFGLIVAAVVNLFMRNSMLDMVVSCIGVLVFVGLTAYDAQKIKQLLNYSHDEDTGIKLGVLGALSLYLDFVNLFLYLLRFFGRRK